MTRTRSKASAAKPRRAPKARTSAGKAPSAQPRQHAWTTVFGTPAAFAAAIQAVALPDFEHAGRVHDWRNHVPDPLKRAWDGLSQDAQLVVYYMAEIEADNEEWE